MNQSVARVRGIAIIGFGAIARFVLDELRRDERLAVLGVFCRPERDDAARAVVPADVPILHDPEDVSDHIDLVLDCAGHPALRQYGEALLAKGLDVMTVSAGALADDDLCAALHQAASKSGSRLWVVSGAIGGLDVLSSARRGGLSKVTYRGRKAPASWRGTLAEAAVDLAALEAPFTHFAGTARQAALDYPKNANVAAAVALAGLGFDDTHVELIADPAATLNRHEIEAEGAFGRFAIQIDGRALPDNPKSSALTAMSMVRTVLLQAEPLVVA